jgi:predicted dehydrogenase
MAMDRNEINHICQLSEAKHLVVEGGFEARYKAVWEHTKNLVLNGEIGEICGLQATACWNAGPHSWYYSQEKSRGMPITHMTYAFLNPLTWIFGNPVSLSAIANQKGIQFPGMVKEVSCAVNIQYGQNIPCQLFASYVAHKGAPNWKIFIQGTMGALEVFPEEFGNGKIWHYAKDSEPVRIGFNDAEDPFETQAWLFIQAILSKDSGLLNTPQMCIKDVCMVSAIHESLKGNHTFHFKSDFASV